MGLLHKTRIDLLDLDGIHLYLLRRNILDYLPCGLATSSQIAAKPELIGCSDLSALQWLTVLAG